MKIEEVADIIKEILLKELDLNAEVLYTDPLGIRPSNKTQEIYIYPFTTKVVNITRTSKEYSFDFCILVLQAGKDNNTANMQTAQQIQELFGSFSFNGINFNLKKNGEEALPFDASAFQQTNINYAMIPVHAVFWE